MAPALTARTHGFAVQARTPAPPSASVEEDAFDDDDDDDDGMLALGAITHWWLSARAFVRRTVAANSVPHDDFEFRRQRQRRRLAACCRARRIGRARRSAASTGEPRRAGILRRSDDRRSIPTGRCTTIFDDDDDCRQVRRPTGARSRPSARPAGAARVDGPAPRPVPGARVQREAQTSLIGPASFEMPSLHFLSEPKNVVRDATLSKDALEQNARLLEGVLEDFGVKGEIIHVRPGPVVTLYELEPAPGIKSSRVIGLADDIARSMSAIAARVAVVPGRNAIGIELPNAKRETVYLREILASRDFETTKAKLALALGKTIDGEPVIVDIAKMPHLLVAGTTGSGKSVAINTMILSLLYRLTPEECRLIMIDPKMLELSVYDGIPHLLTPVVTDPKKAVVALKWTVREMEDRYRKMSKVGVRNIDGFNARVAAADKKGERISRTVQTGFDRRPARRSTRPRNLDLEPMPYIVVIIDEMADLMMVAGKDIEGAVQRLAQMARAAGIHVIMATQRPSVDVITGTIKANFPTRISFQVTSKIDCRTILGEQGAEQLLGMGDMLYMAGGGRIQRVHGPFVSDDEVEKVVAHLKPQGVPEYLDAITEDDGEDEDEAVRQGRRSGRRRRFRRFGRSLRPGRRGRPARRQGLDQLHPAPPRHRLQPRRLDHRADGEGRHRRSGQPCRQARNPGADRRRQDLTAAICRRVTATSASDVAVCDRSPHGSDAPSNLRPTGTTIDPSDTTVTKRPRNEKLRRHLCRSRPLRQRGFSAWARRAWRRCRPACRHWHRDSATPPRHRPEDRRPFLQRHDDDRRIRAVRPERRADRRQVLTSSGPARSASTTRRPRPTA